MQYVVGLAALLLLPLPLPLLLPLPLPLLLLLSSSATGSSMLYRRWKLHTCATLWPCSSIPRTALSAPRSTCSHGSSVFPE